MCPQHGHPTRTANNVPRPPGSAPVTPLPPGKAQHTGAGFVPMAMCLSTSPTARPEPAGTCRHFASQLGSLGPPPNMRSPRQKVAIYDRLGEKKKIN